MKEGENPGGGHAVSCDGNFDWSECYKKAEAFCSGKKYTVIDSRMDLLDNVPRRRLLVRCQR